ncbi:MAG TPA: hypothetical protein VFA09_21150 [Ktedonobacteraceae bacterium]|jgi:hypothetical protein|nr:hypothetical protein [Ktedonobacteraceae bacterium]
MNKIDITIKKVCDYCHLEWSFHHPDSVPLITLHAHSIVGLSIPETLVRCPQCGRALYLRIQAQPYDLANHLDSPVAEWYFAHQEPETTHD